MIFISMLLLISSNTQDHIFQGCIGSKSVVLDCYGWSLDILNFSCFDLFEILGIADDGLFFKITDHSMSYFRKEYIQQKIEVPKNCLGKQYCITLKPIGFGYFDKYHEMHPLVLSFCKQGLNPPSRVMLHA